MKEKVTLVLFSGDLDKALACFNIATAAAGMGMEVTIFFTFFGFLHGFRRGSMIKMEDNTFHLGDLLLWINRYHQTWTPI